MAPIATAHFGFTEMGCAAVDAKDHIALGVSEDGVGVRWDVVKKVTGALHCVFSGSGLGGGKGAEGDKDCRIDGSTIV